MTPTQPSRMLRLALVVMAGILCFGLIAQAQTGQLKQRSEIDPQYQWKLADMYPSVEAWERDFEFLKANYSRLDQFRGRLTSSPETLHAAFKLRDSLSLISDNLYVYANLKLDEDNRVSESQERGDRISSLNAQLGEASSYFEPEILAMDDATLTGFVGSPALAEYAFYLKSLIRSKEHILSDKEEALLAAAAPVSGAFSRIFNMINDADINYGTIIDENGNEVELSKGRYSNMLESSDRRVRRDANQAYNKAYLKYVNSLSATLASSVKKDHWLAKTRKYPTCLDMSLDPNAIPTSVFYKIIEAVNANLTPLHKWASLRKRMMGIDTLYPYDLWVPLVKEGQKKYEYEEAVDIITRGLQPMGKIYMADFSKGLSSGWVDVYETEGKGSGAYQWGTYSSHPYLLMNYSGSMEDVFTLAHEMGHAMHSFYTNQHEPYQYSNHYLFTAEVASTCNEAVLIKYMLEKTKDKQEKINLLNYYITQIIGTFYTQVWFSEFELAIHKRVEEGGALSADYFRQTYREIYQKYWGPELVIDSLNDVGGLRISHFYRQYYVYQYATCYAAAQMISQRILEKQKGALEQYQQFLNTGSSMYPVDVLKAAGVDMTTTEPVDRTIKLFGSLVDQLEKLLMEQNAPAKGKKG
ncbi:MAG: oligoendopeptidase F [bacterium]|nr:oligoendopeptidase F [bacterium]